VIGSDGLFEACGTALALAKPPKRIAEIVLGRGPVERDAFAGVFLQRLARGGDGLFEACGAPLALAERSERIA